jgi:hypothetical protein
VKLSNRETHEVAPSSGHAESPGMVMVVGGGSDQVQSAGSRQRCRPTPSADSHHSAGGAVVSSRAQSARGAGPRGPRRRTQGGGPFKDQGPTTPIHTACLPTTSSHSPQIASALRFLARGRSGLNGNLFIRFKNRRKNGNSTGKSFEFVHRR